MRAGRASSESSGEAPRPVTASYRFQLTADFGFDDVAANLAMLRRLGVSHVYLSPITEAVTGSAHGYDVVDHTAVRAEFGGEEGLFRLLDAAADVGLGVLVDHVPNHVSVERPESNPLWWSLLAGGRASDAAAFFDVDWDAGDGKIIVAQLPEPLDDMIRSQRIEVVAGPHGDEICVGSTRYPLRPDTTQGGTAHGDVLPDGVPDGLAAILDQQHYRLQWWRDPRRNVRRFFTIDDLVGVRVEDPAVAAHVDTIPARLVEHPAFAGVRIDHIDGLADPGEYLHRLRRRLGGERDDGQRGGSSEPMVLVEKIVAAGESLPASWPVEGTTGYEHITTTEHALLDPAAREPLERVWRRADPSGRSFADIETIARREVVHDGLRPELERVVRAILDAERDALRDDGVTHESAEDSPKAALTEQATVELTLALERYRTYLPDPGSRTALAEVVGRAAEAAGSGELRHEIERVARIIQEYPQVARRWEQFTGPVMAKGAEDRAFYRYFRLASLCEVGGAPGDFDLAVDEFHRRQVERSRRRPGAMLASTTHDTKRSAGVRARSLALAAYADTWESTIADHLGGDTRVGANAVSTSPESNGVTDAVVETRPGTEPKVDARFVSLAAQTAVTAQPITVERLHDYLVKAAREGDEISSWTDPDDDVERDLERVARQAISATTTGDMSDLAANVRRLGAAIQLRLAALHLTCPGFPDLYQGSPASLRSLVDPDNRRPPSWSDLRDLVETVSSTDVESAICDRDVDLALSVLTERTLRLRRRRPSSFDDHSGYRALEVRGSDADHVIAYARTERTTGSNTDRGRALGEPTVVVVVSRARATPIDAAETTFDLPAGTWRSILHDDARIGVGGDTRLADVISSAEVGVLERTDI